VNRQRWLRQRRKVQHRTRLLQMGIEPNYAKRRALMLAYGEKLGYLPPQ